MTDSQTSLAFPEGVKCDECGWGDASFRKVCPKCRSKKLSLISLGERGRILTFTVIRYPPLGFEKLAPYAVAVIELQGGIKLVSRLVDCRIEEIRIGIEVERVPVSQSGEALSRMPSFRPVNS